MMDGVYPRDDRQVGQVLEDTRILARLVEDLRTLAHSESGTLALAKEPTDLAVLLAGTATAFPPEARARCVEIETSVADDLPAIDVDPVRLREVVYRRVHNSEIEDWQ
jgi:two-component system sensor histidine kinase BaeS